MLCGSRQIFLARKANDSFDSKGCWSLLLCLYVFICQCEVIVRVHHEGVRNETLVRVNLIIPVIYFYNEMNTFHVPVYFKSKVCWVSFSVYEYNVIVICDAF